MKNIDAHHPCHTYILMLVIGHKFISGNIISFYYLFFNELYFGVIYHGANIKKNFQQTNKARTLQGERRVRASKQEPQK